MREAAPAKVNLFLHVVGRRGDGYHLLDSLAVFAAVGDVLHAEPADALSLDLRGTFADGLRAEPDNLVLRAARALARWSVPSSSTVGSRTRQSMWTDASFSPPMPVFVPNARWIVPSAFSSSRTSPVIVAPGFVPMPSIVQMRTRVTPQGGTDVPVPMP